MKGKDSNPEQWQELVNLSIQDLLLGHLSLSLILTLIVSLRINFCKSIFELKIPLFPSICRSQYNETFLSHFCKVSLIAAAEGQTLKKADLCTCKTVLFKLFEPPHLIQMTKYCFFHPTSTSIHTCRCLHLKPPVGTCTTCKWLLKDSNPDQVFETGTCQLKYGRIYCINTFPSDHHMFCFLTGVRCYHWIHT